MEHASLMGSIYETARENGPRAGDAAGFTSLLRAHPESCIDTIIEAFLPLILRFSDAKKNDAFVRTACSRPPQASTGRVAEGST